MHPEACAGGRSLHKERMTAASLLSGPRDAVVRLKAQPPSLQSLRAWDEATSAISNASARASLLRSVHPDAAMRDAGERCEQEAEALSTELALDRSEEHTSELQSH